FTPAALAALERLRRAGVTLLGQSVLLAGVNDAADTLADLMRGFVAAGVKPYYLHHPDLAPGTAHFRLPIARGLALVGALRGRLSGLAQPAYMLDIPGGFGKVELDGPAVRPLPDGAWALTDFRGGAHVYRDG
ncbi:MAG: lysine 2,3-aminomutase, partial [Methylobacteriaceae bacterium]|nr:lysine 2,3-aminomutase [Methylobacteriaceae bacterium]